MSPSRNKSYGCGRPFQIRIASGKKEFLYSCVLAYGTMNLAVWPLAVVIDVCSSVGGIATRPFTILYIIIAFILAHLTEIMIYMDTN
jgi:hypothetical protein